MATSSGTNVVVGVQLAPNSVKSLHLYPFERRTLAEKLIVKELGPDKPEVQITQQAQEKEKTYREPFAEVSSIEKLGELAVGTPMQSFASLAYCLKQELLLVVIGS